MDEGGASKIPTPSWRNMTVAGRGSGIVFSDTATEKLSLLQYISFYPNLDQKLQLNLATLTQKDMNVAEELAKKACLV